MSNFAIITDTACDLDRKLRERFGVDDYVAGYLVFPDGHSEHSDLDWNNISPKDFYGSMKDKTGLYTTAQPGLEEMKDTFKKFLADGTDVLFLSLSSALSGTYNAACIVAKELKEEYPQQKLICVDSRRYCGAEGCLVMYASELRAAVKTIEEVAAWVEENRNRVHQMGVLEDLFFSKRMGRVSGAAAVMGTLVGIRPMADISPEGMSTVLGKVKGRKAAYAATIEYMNRTIEKPEEQIICISHSEREEQANTLKQMVENTFHPREVIITNASQACGPALGPGLYAVFYMGTPVSEGLAEEKRIFAEVTGK